MTRHALPVLLILAMGLASCGGDEPAPTPPVVEEVASTLTIDYPIDLSVYPPDLVAPRLRWKDATEGVTAWRVRIEADDDDLILDETVPGEPPPIGIIDPTCIARTNALPKRPGPFERSWQVPEALWDRVRSRTVERWATITITGVDASEPPRALSRGWTRMKTSADPVAAPIFYRDVPLAPATTAKGKIQPLPMTTGALM